MAEIASGGGGIVLPKITDPDINKRKYSLTSRFGEKPTSLTPTRMTPGKGGSAAVNSLESFISSIFSGGLFGGQTNLQVNTGGGGFQGDFDPSVFRNVSVEGGRPVVGGTHDFGFGGEGMRDFRAPGDTNVHDYGFGGEGMRDFNAPRKSYDFTYDPTTYKAGPGVGNVVNMPYAQAGDGGLWGEIVNNPDPFGTQSMPVAGSGLWDEIVNANRPVTPIDWGDDGGWGDDWGGGGGGGGGGGWGGGGGGMAQKGRFSWGGVLWRI